MIEIINKIALNYCSLDKLTISNWEVNSKIIEYRKGEQIVSEGQKRHKLFYVIKGSLKAYYINEDKKIIDWFAFGNEFITSSTSYFTDEPSLHFIETMEDCIILETEKNKVEMLCKNNHDFEHLFRLILSKVIVQFRYRVVSIQFKTVKQRYDSLIKQYPQIELTVPLGDIASYLGITQETLSRIRASYS
ncbi:Crp/Fnr family transcriptional regulator [uncultured Aquimarina sp.]|uniref:Crp/Fnr family transcriptional regulator n=1 Tax=uncultured Aquimarina sp. TaxID=575652 RepID=UPI00261E82B4|nr:Crp/Fnr family transcriptional regulator [uncultured Aquimarina sp.]